MARARGSRHQQFGWMRAALILLVGGVLTFFVGVVSFAGVARGSSPQAVLAWYGGDAEALENLAQSNLGSGDEARTIAHKMAVSALRRSPLSPDAARMLSVLLLSQGDQAASLPPAQYAERLSRRDFSAQLMLIEAAVRRNDIDGALRHYDTALRTSQRASTLLLPILVRATEHEEVAQKLAARLEHRPAWRDQFLWSMLSDGSDVSRATSFILKFADPDDDEGMSMLSTLLARLTNEGRFGGAFAVYRQLTGSPGEVLIDGDFEAESRFAPVEWRYATDYNLAASVGARDVDGRALFLTSREGRGGELARQLVGLPPGTHRVSALVGGVTTSPSAAPVLSIRCATAGSRQLASFVFPLNGDWSARLNGSFVVPEQGCSAQWLVIEMPSAFGSSDREAWIDAVRIGPT